MSDSYMVDFDKIKPHLDALTGMDAKECFAFEVTINSTAAIGINIVKCRRDDGEVAYRSIVTFPNVHTLDDAKAMMNECMHAILPMLQQNLEMEN